MIYLTGGNGFIGKSIYKFLKIRNLKIVKLKRDYLENLPDLSNEENILVHCAWGGIYGSDRKSDKVQEDNLFLTDTVIKVAKYLKINKIIAFGSQAEYGIVNKKIREDMVLNPIDPYGIYKVRTCRILSEFCKLENKKLIWLRLFGVYGPYDNPRWFIPYVINSALNNFSPKLTDCDQIWDYLYIEDLCECILKIIIYEKDKSDFYNFSSNQEILLSDIVDKIFKIIKPSKSKPLYSSINGNSDLKYLNGDNSKLQRIYNWKPNTSIEEGLLKTIEFFRNQERKKIL